MSEYPAQCEGRAKGTPRAKRLKPGAPLTVATGRDLMAIACNIVVQKSLCSEHAQGLAELNVCVEAQSLQDQEKHADTSGVDMDSATSNSFPLKCLRAPSDYC